MKYERRILLSLSVVLTGTLTLRGYAEESHSHSSGSSKGGFSHTSAPAAGFHQPSPRPMPQANFAHPSMPGMSHEASEPNNVGFGVLNHRLPQPGNDGFGAMNRSFSPDHPEGLGEQSFEQQPVMPAVGTPSWPPIMHATKTPHAGAMQNSHASATMPQSFKLTGMSSKQLNSALTPRTMPGESFKIDGRDVGASALTARDRQLNEEIHADRGLLDGHHGQLEHQQQAINTQEQMSARENGGHLTASERQQLGREENHLQHEIGHDMRRDFDRRLRADLWRDRQEFWRDRQWRRYHDLGWAWWQNGLWQANGSGTGGGANSSSGPAGAFGASQGEGLSSGADNAFGAFQGQRSWNQADGSQPYGSDDLADDGSPADADGYSGGWDQQPTSWLQPPDSGGNETAAPGSLNAIMPAGFTLVINQLANGNYPWCQPGGNSQAAALAADAASASAGNWVPAHVVHALEHQTGTNGLISFADLHRLNWVHEREGTQPAEQSKPQPRNTDSDPLYAQIGRDLNSNFSSGESGAGSQQIRSAGESSNSAASWENRN